jgi:excisionase family DNA binding protein
MKARDPQIGRSITMGVDTEPRTVTVEQAAKELGIGRSLAYELARSGELPAPRLGHRFVIPRARLDAMLAADADTEQSAA